MYLGRIPLAREGYPFILASIFAIIICWMVGLRGLSYVFSGVTIFIISFFRDPERDTPSEEDSIVSPADGKIIIIDRIFEDRFLKKDAVKISIFMNVFNVHVNRVPVSGKVLDIFYNPGKFFSADKDKASLENEQNAVLIEAGNGKRFVVNQIAGLIARRIVCYAKKGDMLEKGKRFGMIRFGSRLDVYLPADCRTDVSLGDTVKAGSTILAYW
ncbi:MAG: phosphatidylserine decarboxylase family protein [Deltaproteobacteria bacterium]|nr:phosphatidylserine decarboxylase family protein [Deltaproteobacteria bacterium]